MTGGRNDGGRGDAGGRGGVKAPYRAGSDDAPPAPPARADRAASAGPRTDAAARRGPAILPRPEGMMGGPLALVIAAMCYLAGLALLAALISGAAAERWSAGLAGAATVELAPRDDVSPEAQAEAALAVLRRAPEVARARLLDAQEIAALLAPALGEDFARLGAPTPQLIDVELRGSQPLERLAADLAAAAPGLRLDDHGVERDRAERLAGSARALGWFVVVVAALALAATLVFAARASLEAQRPVVDILHQVGARDGFIAGEFQSHFLALGARGGLIGAGAAALTGFLAGRLLSGDAAATEHFLPSLAPPVWVYLALALVPVMAAGLALVTARVAILRALARTL